MAVYEVKKALAFSGCSSHFGQNKSEIPKDCNKGSFRRGADDYEPQ
jgi:hypothetical protein